MSTSIPPPQYPQPPPYPYPPYPPYPPPKKSDRTLAIIIIVVVLVVVVGTIVLAAILYVMVSGLIGEGPPPPSVTLAPPIPTPGQATIRVIEAEPRDPLPLYSASLKANGTEVSRIVVLFDNATSNILVFQDANDDGALSPGDFFTVATVASTDYELWIMYQGRLIATAIWTT